MLREEDIAIELKCQQYVCKTYMRNLEGLAREKLPQAQIVYDGYHMQTQYGKDVPGVVRLNEVRKHKALSKELSVRLAD